MLRDLLCLGTVTTIKDCLNHSEHLVCLFCARLRGNGSYVGLVVPVFVACWRKQLLLERDDLIGANSGVGKNDELTVSREVVGEGCCSRWVLGGCIESANLSLMFWLSQPTWGRSMG